ncbi:MAG: UbiA family prenyltransferase [Bryobacteraceae bacterium]|jgi:4-hydroxybenzoate polyprenyltransferase
MNAVATERVQAAESDSPPPPLVVDLDGTLVKTDLLLESVIALLRKHPVYLFLLPLWALHGKAWFKHHVARRVSLDMSSLPWRTGFIGYLSDERAHGRSIVLATGSDMLIARQVADHLKLFDKVFASDGSTNLRGRAKRDLLVGEFGEGGFDYAADGGGGIGLPDRTVWRAARNAIRVPREPLLRQARLCLAALRPAHWLKNLLVFVPLIAAHRLLDLPELTKSLLAFVAFGLCASSGYLLNDLLDLESDRHHPQKRFRPFASGDLPLGYALIAIPLLLGAACFVGASASPLLVAILVLYFGMSAAYSLRIKRIAILDVLFLAGLYSVRIIAGTAATGIESSHWLLAFSTFLFFSLALVKRYGELVLMRKVDGQNAHARGYEIGDAELLAAMGTASGYLAVLVLALYIASDKAAVLYSHPHLLWFLCPLLLYWISQVWLTAHRGGMHHDPVVFATSDRTSRILLLLMAATAILAIG